MTKQSCIFKIEKKNHVVVRQKSFLNPRIDICVHPTVAEFWGQSINCYCARRDDAKVELLLFFNGSTSPHSLANLKHH